MMNVLYQKQIKWIRIIVCLIFFCILQEIFTAEGDFFIGTFLSLALTTTLLLMLIEQKIVFTEDNKRNQDLLKMALQEQTAAVVITNPKRMIEYVNEPFLQMIGYRHRDVIGRKPSFLQGELTTSSSVSYVREKLAELVPFEADIVNYRKNGEAYVCHIAITPIFSDGNLTHFVAFEEDIETIEMPNVAKNEALAIMEQVKILFEQEKLYCDRQLQLAYVAAKLQVPPRRLSEIIKENEGQSFTDFVNTYRIKAVIEHLQNGKNEHLTLEAISQICGFNSKSSFNIAFKNVTGTTPSNYLTEMAY